MVVLRSSPQLLRRPWTFWLRWEEHFRSVTVSSLLAATSPTLGSHVSDSTVFLCLTVAACLLLQLSVSMTVNQAIEILREHRGGGAIQTVKVLNPCLMFRPGWRPVSVLPFEVKPRLLFPQQQYNFLHEFREKYAAYQESSAEARERSVSRWPHHSPTLENIVVLSFSFFNLLWCISNMHLLVIAL